MNLLFFCFCFAFLALQVLLIEGPHKRAKGKKENPKSTAAKTTQSKPPSAAQQPPFLGENSIYAESFGNQKIAYLIEDNNFVHFGTRNLTNGRSLHADRKAAKSFQPEAYQKDGPEVAFALKDLEAFASILLTYKGQSDRLYYHPDYYGYMDKTFKDYPEMHQVTAMFSAKDDPNSQICCSVFVDTIRLVRSGNKKAYCGHPICFAATEGMTDWNSGKWTCQTPPIKEQPATGWAIRSCLELIISENYKN